MASFFPSIGTWFQEISTNTLFEVVAIDEKYGTIEVQYEDGDIAEFDMESWGQLDITMSAAPDSDNTYMGTSTSPFENDYSNEMMYTNNPLEEIEPDSFSGFDDLF